MANRYEFRGKALLQALLLVPMILPPFVGAIGFQQIFGVYGSFNVLLARWTGLGPIDVVGQAGYWGVIALEALALYPIMYLNVAAALGNVDPAMEQAAANLGARGLTRFRRITLPLIMPGIFAGAAIVFVWAFTELGTPLIMQYTRCTPVQVFDALKEIGTNPFPYALVFVMLAASVALYAIARALLGGQSYALQAKATVAAAPVPLGRAGNRARAAGLRRRHRRGPAPARGRGPDQLLRARELVSLRPSPRLHPGELRGRPRPPADRAQHQEQPDLRLHRRRPRPRPRPRHRPRHRAERPALPRPARHAGHAAPRRARDW